VSATPGGTGGHDVVRPFVMTGGRTRAERRDLRIETMLTAVGGVGTAGLSAEQVKLLKLCERPISIAEASAALGLVIGVTTILAADLVSGGRLEVHQTDPVEIELDVLSRMIDAVKAL
jgi:Na+/glutamate symporter